MYDMFGISVNYMLKFLKNYLIEIGDFCEVVSWYIE